MDVLKFDTAALASQVALQSEEVICPICQVRGFFCIECSFSGFENVCC